VLAILTGGCSSWTGARKPATLSSNSDEAARQRRMTLFESKDEDEKAPPVPLGEKPIAKKSSSAARPPLDSATEILIENELKDATPEERQEWMARIETMSPAQITTALRGRRATLAADFARERDAAIEAPSPAGFKPPTKEEQPFKLASASDEPPSDITEAPPSSDDARPFVKKVNFKPAPELTPQEADVAQPSESDSPFGQFPPAGEELAVTPDDLPRAPEPLEPSPPMGMARDVGVPQDSQNERVTNPELAASEPARPETRVALAPPADQTISRPNSTPAEAPPRGSRFSDWDPTKLFTRKPRQPEAPVTAARPDVPAASSNLPDGPEPFASSKPRQIDPQATYSADELKRMISLLEAETNLVLPSGTPEAQREYIRQHVNLRMMRLVAGDRDGAQDPIPGIDPVDQEFWNSVFWGIATYFDRDRIPDPTDRAGQTASQFLSAARRLQATARLELKNVAFCHRIDGFGVFERFERDEFQAGVPVLIYAELRNFRSEPTTDGRFRTMLRSTVELVRVGKEELVVDRTNFDPTEDVSRSLRTDFYNSYRISLPEHLSPGPYQLRLTVEDETSGKLATQTLGFTIR
jgi:hypothetical protein